MLEAERDMVYQYLMGQEKVISELRKSSATQINAVIKLLKDCRNANRSVFVFGNGGSGSTSSHFVSDLLKTTLNRKNKNRFRAHCLCDNTPVLLAWANDVAYDQVFKEQLANLMVPNDLVIGISGSGNSPNVVNALLYAKEMGGITVALTGMGGGKISKIADVSIVVPSDSMLSIEDIHLMICHLFTTSLKMDE